MVHPFRRVSGGESIGAERSRFQSEQGSSKTQSAFFENLARRAIAQHFLVNGTRRQEIRITIDP